MNTEREGGEGAERDGWQGRGRTGHKSAEDPADDDALAEVAVAIGLAEDLWDQAILRESVLQAGLGQEGDEDHEWERHDLPNSHDVLSPVQVPRDSMERGGTEGHER
jgi:hypothetical protein